MSDHIARLRARACVVAARQERRLPRAFACMTKWVSRRDGYLAATRALSAHDPMRARAVLLADAAAWRLAAWQAVAQGDAEEAWKRSQQALRLFREAMVVGVP
jgi:hypothetical protein